MQNIINHLLGYENILGRVFPAPFKLHFLNAPAAFFANLDPILASLTASMSNLEESIEDTKQSGSLAKSGFAELSAGRWAKLIEHHAKNPA